VVDGAAGSVHLANALIGNPEGVAGSDDPTQVPGNNTVATALQDFMRDPDWGLNTFAPAPAGINPLGLGTSVQDTYKGIMVGVATAQQAAETGFSIESASVTQLETLLESESGVSVDEELINMTQANQAFEAASQVIRQADEMSDTTLRLLG
jgi:flagellar hook-associated protein 1 FlgK